MRTGGSARPPSSASRTPNFAAATPRRYGTLDSLTFSVPAGNRVSGLWNISAAIARITRLEARELTTLPTSRFRGDELTELRGRPGSGSPPMSANRAFILGSARPALISRLRRSMISAGVLRGAPCRTTGSLRNPARNPHGRQLRQHLRARRGGTASAAAACPALTHSRWCRAWWRTTLAPACRANRFRADPGRGMGRGPS